MKEGEVDLLSARVKSLELELKILKAQLPQTVADSEPFSSLYGVLQGQSESTYEEIQETEYRVSEKLT